MKEFVEKFANNLIVSSFVPAIAFWAVVAFLFAPLVPDEFLARILKMANHPGIAVLIVGAVTGFILSHLNLQIQNTYMGEFLLKVFPKAATPQIKCAEKMKTALQNICTTLAQLETEMENSVNVGDTNHENNSKDLENAYYLLKSQEYGVRHQLDVYFPPSRELILPTTIGNILRAAEAYPSSRYGIDTVIIWPRLIRFIPPEEYSKIETSNNRLSFLLNFSLLALVVSIGAIFAAMYQLLGGYLSNNGLILFGVFRPSYSPTTFYLNAVLYLLAGLISVGVSRFFYIVALPIAIEYGNTIRVAFDQFRWAILRQLDLKLPRDNYEERDLWQKVSEFLCVGEEMGPLHIDYGFGDDFLSAYFDHKKHYPKTKK